MTLCGSRKQALGIRCSARAGGEVVRLLCESDPRPAFSMEDHPLLHEPAVPGVEELSESFLDQLVGSPLSQLHDESSPDDHREDLSVQLERIRTELSRAASLLFELELLGDFREARIPSERSKDFTESRVHSFCLRSLSRHRAYRPIPAARSAAVSWI